MTFSVADALDGYVAALEEERLPDGFLHPSGLFGCARRAVYEFTGTPKSDPPDARAKRVFRVGNILHEFAQAAMSKHPGTVIVANEVKVFDPERRLKGSADSVVLLADGSWLVVEIKSINSWGFKKGGLPKADHRLQAACYLSILRRYGASATVNGVDFTIPPLGSDSKVRFCYISKDDLKIEEFDVELTPELEAEIENQLFVIETAILEHELPPRLPYVVSTRKDTYGQMVKDPLCGYCSWATTCWERESND